MILPWQLLGLMQVIKSLKTYLNHTAEVPHIVTLGLHQFLQNIAGKREKPVFTIQTLLISGTSSSALCFCQVRLPLGLSYNLSNLHNWVSNFWMSQITYRFMYVTPKSWGLWSHTWTIKRNLDIIFLHKGMTLKKASLFCSVFKWLHHFKLHWTYKKKL